MDTLSLVADGFQVALSPENLLFCFIGVFLGTVIGMLPGLGAATGLAILLPLTIGLDPVGAIIMLAGVYYGTQYGGTISSILITTPGDPGTVVTAIDGYQMAKKGRAGAALGIAAAGSFIAGTVSIVFLMIAAPLLSQVALSFGPPEIFAVAVLGLLAVSGFASVNPAKGLVAAAFGLLLGTIGLDPQTGTGRYTFGQVDLLSGVDFIPVTIGLFAIAEVFHQIGHRDEKVAAAGWKDVYPNRDEWRRSRGPIARGSVLGFFTGILPGGGATFASFLSYDMERRISKHPEEFGKGAIEGVAGPESANNAAANGAFVPTLTLGIPGSAATAVLLGAFTVYGVRPGPLLMDEQPELVWGLMASFYVGNLILLVLNLPLAPAFASILRIPYSYLYPAIIMVALVGSYSVENSMFGVWVALVFGVLGYAMKRYGFPAAPLILGLILGPLLEKTLSQSMAIGHGLEIFLQRPIALTIMAVAVAILFGPRLMAHLRRSRSSDSRLREGQR